MKIAKGQSVFIDDVDVILTDKIIKHTNENTDGGVIAENSPAGYSSLNKKEKDTQMSKSKWIVLGVVGVIIITGIVACFICRGGSCCKKKK
jgi:hypothetical protein